MSHIHMIEDQNGDLIDLIYFCSDWCNENYCNNSKKYEYQGEYGQVEHNCNEICANCEEPLRGLTNEHGTDQTDEEWEEWKKSIEFVNSCKISSMATTIK